MSAVFSGNTTPCNDFNINATELNRALADVEILNNGQLTLTKIDGTTFINNIPFFPDFVISGINLSIDVSPNADDLLYTSGTYQIDAVVYTLAAGGTINLTAGHPTDPRVDIIYLDTIADLSEKVKFINTCDAMLHARTRGETFVIACGEFSIKNKPVITYGFSPEKCHLDILKDKALIYYNFSDLRKVLNEFEPSKKNWDAYSSLYTPIPVMNKFKQVFL